MSLCLWLSRLLSSEFDSSAAPWPAWIAASSPHLARHFDAFPDAEVDDREDQHDAEGQLPADAPQVLEALGPVDLQDVAPGVSGREKPVRWPEQRAEPAACHTSGRCQEKKRAPRCKDRAVTKPRKELALPLLNDRAAHWAHSPWEEHSAPEAGSQASPFPAGAAFVWVGGGSLPTPQSRSPGLQLPGMPALKSTAYSRHLLPKGRCRL